MELRIASTFNVETGILPEDVNSGFDDSLNACLSDFFDSILEHLSFDSNKWHLPKRIYYNTALFLQKCSCYQLFLLLCGGDATKKTILYFNLPQWRFPPGYLFGCHWL